MRQCFYALQMNNDNPDEAVIWLITTPPASQIATEEFRETSRSDVAVVEGLDVDTPLIASNDSAADVGRENPEHLTADRLLAHPLELTTSRLASPSTSRGVCIHCDRFALTLTSPQLCSFNRVNSRILAYLLLFSSQVRLWSCPSLLTLFVGWVWAGCVVC